MARGWGQDGALCEAPGFTGHEQNVHSCCHNWRICQKLARSLKDRWGLECDSVCACTQTHTHTHTHMLQGLFVPTLGTEGPDIVFFSEYKGTSALIPVSSKGQQPSVDFASGGSRRAESPWPRGWPSQLSDGRQQLPRPMSPPIPDPEGLQLGWKGRRDQRGKTWVPSLTVGLAVTP